MIITEPELVAVARVVMGKWSESKLWCSIVALIMMMDDGRHMLHVLRNMLAVVLCVELTMSHRVVLLFFIVMLFAAERIVNLCALMLLWVVVLLPRILIGRFTVM